MARLLGKLGTIDVALALSLTPAERYQRRYLPIDPDSAQANRVEEGLTAIRQYARWKVDSWEAGEGETKAGKVPGAYNESSNARPLRRGDGFELGAYTTQPSGGPSTATAIAAALGTVYTANNTSVYPWNAGSQIWGSATAHGGGTPVSIADGGDGQYLYVGFTNNTIRRVEPGVGNTAWYTTSPFTYDPILQAFSGELYALDGDNLYRIDLTTAQTRTLVADVTADGSTWHTTAQARNRMAATERGPIWLQRLESGETLIWEYNVFADAQTRLGRLPQENVTPYDISYHAGFIWVAYRDAGVHTDDGEAFLYFQRGQQKGVLGPFRTLGADAASHRMLIVGQVGEQIVVMFDEALWGYTPSTGGINQICTLAATGIVGAVAYGYDMLVASETGSAWLAKYLQYAATGTLDSGRWDFRYPGLDKALVDVVVEMDPLPTSSTVEMSVQVDRDGTWTSLGTETTNAATTSRFAASTSSGAIVGREFELRATLANGGVVAETPVIRSITARATGAAHQLEWVLAIDCNDSKAGPSQRSSDVLDALASLAASAVVSFTDPWQNQNYETADTYDVTIEDILLPPVDDEGESIAYVKLMALAPVVGS